MEGAFNPEQIFALVDALGIDIFDSSYATLLSEANKAFLLGDDYPTKAGDFQVVDFRDKRWVLGWWRSKVGRILM